MNNATFIYPITQGQKKRLITTYRLNSKGRELKLKHQNILKQIDQSLFNTSVTYAYIPGQNIKNLVQKHIESNYFFKTDIKSFFDSIDHQVLYELIRKYNFDSLIARGDLQELNVQKKDFGIGIGMLISPVLSNLYLIEFDKAMTEFANQNNLVYTRYADDLCFSSQTPIRTEQLTDKIDYELEKLNLITNIKKTEYTNIIKPKSSVKILGLNIVNGTKNHYVTISRKYKRQTFFENNQLVKIGRENYIKYNDDNFML